MIYEFPFIPFHSRSQSSHCRVLSQVLRQSCTKYLTIRVPHLLAAAWAARSRALPAAPPRGCRRSVPPTAVGTIGTARKPAAPRLSPHCPVCFGGSPKLSSTRLPTLPPPLRLLVQLPLPDSLRGRQRLRFRMSAGSKTQPERLQNVVAACC